MILGAGAIDTVDLRPGHRHELLFPLGDDGRVVVFDGFSTGRGIVAEVADGKIRKAADLPFAHVERLQSGAMAVRDRQGRVWIATRGGSRALDAAGKVVAEHRGQVLLADRSGATWFYVADADRTSLARLGPDGEEALIAVPQLRRFACLTESPLGVVWAISGKELVAIHLGAGKLTLGPRILAPRSDYHWCDPAGRVWLTFGNSTGEATCLAVSKPLAN